MANTIASSAHQQLLVLLSLQLPVLHYVRRLPPVDHPHAILDDCLLHGAPRCTRWFPGAPSRPRTSRRGSLGSDPTRDPTCDPTRDPTLRAAAAASKAVTCLRSRKLGGRARYVYTPHATGASSRRWTLGPLRLLSTDGAGALHYLKAVSIPLVGRGGWVNIRVRSAARIPSLIPHDDSTTLDYLPT